MKSREFQFAIGGERIVSVVSPFKGEKQFAEKFERFVEDLAYVVSQARVGATSCGTFGFEPIRGGSNFTIAADQPSQHLVFPYTEEMFACSSGLRMGTSPSMIFGFACWGTLSDFTPIGQKTSRPAYSLLTESHPTSSYYISESAENTVEEFVEFDISTNQYYGTPDTVEERLKEKDKAVRPRLDGDTPLTLTDKFFALHIERFHDVNEAYMGLAIIAHSIRVDHHQIVWPA